MRPICILLLLLPFAEGKAQTRKLHGGIGLTESTLNFQQNAAGAITFSGRYDFLTFPNSSFSLGTHLKIGSEDEYGISFPVIAIVVAALSAANSSPDLSNLSGNSGTVSHSSYSINFFGDIPLLLHYNWGLGSNDNSEKRFGWYIGGGASYTVTGVSLNSSGYARQYHS